MKHSNFRLETEGELLLITIDRPTRLNALNYETSEELSRVFDDFQRSPQLRLAILTASGTRAFSAGNDLHPDETASHGGLPPNGFGGLTTRFDLDKPVIAAVNGLAVGGGFELALACDLIIASEHAEFALLEPRIGLAALVGGLHMLTQQIPLKQAMGIILTGRRVTAQEALRLGFVNDVVAPAELLPAARRWARDILRCAPLSIRASKQAISAMKGKHGQDALDAQYHCEAVQRMLKSADRIEGPRAFNEKRDPVWQGR